MAPTSPPRTIAPISTAVSTTCPRDASRKAWSRASPSPSTFSSPTGAIGGFLIDWDAARQARRRAYRGVLHQGYRLAPPSRSSSGGNQQRLLLAMLPPNAEAAPDGAPHARARHRVGRLGVDAAPGSGANTAPPSSSPRPTSTSCCATATASWSSSPGACWPSSTRAATDVDDIGHLIGGRGHGTRAGMTVRSGADAAGVRRAAIGVAPFLVALAFAGLLVLLVGENPFEAFRLILEGSLGSSGQALRHGHGVGTADAGGCRAGRHLRRRALEHRGRRPDRPRRDRSLPHRPLEWRRRATVLVVPLTLIVGVAFGIAWALLAGILKTRGKVNEIFGGLGLDFVAARADAVPHHRALGTARHRLDQRDRAVPARGLAAGPRRARASRRSRSSSPSSRSSAVWLLLRGTRVGLKLKAVGRNTQSARLLGIPTDRYVLGAFAICGALAGLAGAIQATGFHHKLVPSVSGWLRLPGHPGRAAGRIPSRLRRPDRGLLRHRRGRQHRADAATRRQLGAGWRVLTGVLVLFALIGQRPALMP